MMWPWGNFNNSSQAGLPPLATGLNRFRNLLGCHYDHLAWGIWGACAEACAPQLSMNGRYFCCCYYYYCCNWWQCWWWAQSHKKKGDLPESLHSFSLVASLFSNHFRSVLPFFEHFHSPLAIRMWLTRRLFFAENIGGVWGTEIRKHQQK